MKTMEELEEDIRELLILNNRDINIHNYQDLINNAGELGYDTGALAILVNEVYNKTDWRSYDRIYEQISTSRSAEKGMFYEKDVKEIIESVKSDLSANKVIPYIISIISKAPYNFEPRELTPPDWNSFRNVWMNEHAWQHYLKQVEPVSWCDETARTLEQIGEICFRKKEDAIEYLENAHYLLPLITLITRNPARTKSFERIFEEERDIEKRYLTIIYRLNNSLPFRFYGKMYNTLSELLNDGCASNEAFHHLETFYKKGYIHIWLRETKVEAAAHLTDRNDKNGFLTFLYKINDQYPYYLNGEKYGSPALLVDAAKRMGVLWPQISSAIDERYLHTWFAGLNNHHWNEQLDKSISVIANTGLYNEEESKLASVQTLINLIDKDFPQPSVSVTPGSLSLLNTEGSNPITQVIQLRLANSGFVKMHVRIEPVLDGISLDKEVVKFYSLTDNSATQVILTVCPMQLLKDKRYDLQVVITSVYEQIRIPVEVSIIFPKKAYINEMLKYGGIGILFFIFIGFIAGGAYSDLFAFVLMLAGLISSYRFIIKKYKKNVNGKFI